MAKKKPVQKKRVVKKNALSSPVLEAASAKIVVVGIGGGGGSIVADIAPSVEKVDFVIANTDQQALKAAIKGMKRGSSARIKCFQFGQDLTGGLGTGMSPRIGELAGQKEKERIKEMLKKADICLLVASLGGGTGSGASIVFAQAGQELGILTVGIFTLPFQFEGEKRAEIARKAIERMKETLNVLVVVPNDKIFTITDKTTALQTAFSSINHILASGLAGLIETIYRPSLINIDFADLRMILEGKGRMAYLNSAQAAGPERAVQALRKVLKNPLQEYDIEGAERILFNISGSKELKMSEVEYISKEIFNCSRKAKVVFGISQSPALGDKIQITLLAAGCGEKTKSASLKKRPKRPDRKPAITEKPEGKKKGEKQAKENQVPAEPQPKQKELAITSPEEKPAEKKETSEGERDSRAKLKIKRNGLELKKVAEEAEQEILKKEEEWETPAFLRREK